MTHSRGMGRRSLQEGNRETYVDAERTFALVKKYRVNVLRSQVIETHGLQLVGLD
jgi:hypothetical protein